MISANTPVTHRSIALGLLRNFGVPVSADKPAETKISAV